MFKFVYKYEIFHVNEIATLGLTVYPKLIDCNIQKAVEIAGSNIFRPHINNCKTPEVIRMFKASGIGHFKVATIAEVELLGM